MDEQTCAAVASTISNLAKQHNPNDDKSFSGQMLANSDFISLPGPNTIAKATLEKELSALAARIQYLELKSIGTNGQALPITPIEPGIPPQAPSIVSRRSAHLRNKSVPKEPRSAWVDSFLTNPLEDGQLQRGPTLLTQEQQDSIRDAFKRQDEEIKSHKQTIQGFDMQVADLKRKIDGVQQGGNQDIENMTRELTKSQQANTAFQKALREIEYIVTAVAAGDLSKKVLIHAKEMDPSIATFKRTINKMVDQLQAFAFQVTHLAREVGTEGRLGGQAVLPDVSGIWQELTQNVNMMASNLTDQVREIAVVTTAVANGDLGQKITRPAKGEILQLQKTINTMVDQLRTFATEVIRVARDVGTNGVLGGQAKIEGVQGIWSELTIDVNAMANNLTTQVRDIAEVTTAVAKGDLTRKVEAQCRGEILELKSTINSMVDQLQSFAQEVTKLAREVGTEGRLGGQATVHGVEGTWKDLTENVNGMANNLTTQVREIAEVTTAVAKGDLSKKVGANVQGEILELKITINSMVDRLSTFALEVSKVAREVGTEGTLGGQAKVDNVEGKWKDLTDNVNTMAENLTDQVRSISDVTQAIARGDMSRKIHVHAQGEILLLKDTINDMVTRLDDWSLAVKGVARDVGVDGKMGGQASTEGLAGRWKDITLDVNTMAMNLTSQVRAFSDITSAANVGDFTQEISIQASGEMDELKRKINKMVSGLRESIEKNTKAREIAEQANKTKSEFLANMSHEIRTPMNGIIGMTQLTLDTDLDAYQREMLITVSNLANSLLTIIDDILDISKIEANRMELEEIPYSLRATVFNSLKTLAVKANERFIDLSYQADSTIPDYVVGDSFRLRQILVNLVGNALKFTEHGEVSIRIGKTSQVRCGPNEYAIMLSVCDTGIGIHRDKLDLIFDTFQQADGSTTRKFGGTGLGLSISKRLVKLMGGDMWVESDYGHGSSFHFTYKVRLGDTNINSIRPQLQPYRNHTVLFIDQGHTGCGDEITAAIEQLELRPLRISIQKREEVTTCLPSLRSHTCDCVVVDSSHTARVLRTVEQFKYIPLVMLAPVVKVSFKSALEDGVSSYMTTPCLPIDLGNALIPALEGRATAAIADQSRSFDILLAEDNAVNQRLAVKILEKYKHKVTVANNGLEAFEAVKVKRYDAVLMDVQMPIMGGFEATGNIREYEAENQLSRTPIVALTAHAMLGDREKCIQAQMDDYLSKPLKQHQLIQTILRCVTMSGAMLEHRNKSRRSVLVDQQKITSEPKPERPRGPVTPTTPRTPRRPGLESRGFTEAVSGMESPDGSSADMLNPMEGLVVRSNST